jgi:hypothetical protein
MRTGGITMNDRDRKMILRPGEWPIAPLLPVVNRKAPRKPGDFPEAGVLIAWMPFYEPTPDGADARITVIHALMYDTDGIAAAMRAWIARRKGDPVPACPEITHFENIEAFHAAGWSVD